MQRDFAASTPNELWVADLSYLRRWEGLLFLAFIIDAFSRMIVGWQLASHMRTTLVLDALRMALGMRGPGADLQLVHHSDSEYVRAGCFAGLTRTAIDASDGSDWVERMRGPAASAWSDPHSARPRWDLIPWTCRPRLGGRRFMARGHDRQRDLMRA